VSGPDALVWPALAQILWTLLVMLAAGRARVAAVRAGEVRLSAIALSGEVWPEHVKKLGNNMNNQFETPTLFYALVLLAMLQDATGWPMAVLAWLYVASRVAHSAVHATSNDVRLRFRIFGFGIACLVGLWAGLVLHALAGT
jgi:hypothetical protein